MFFNMISQYQLVNNDILYAGDIMKPLKTRISITIDDPLLEKIKYLAEYEDRSVSSYINLVLREHLEKLEEKK